MNEYEDSYEVNYENDENELVNNVKIEEEDSEEEKNKPGFFSTIKQKIDDNKEERSKKEQERLIKEEQKLEAMEREAEIKQKLAERKQALAERKNAINKANKERRSNTPIGKIVSKAGPAIKDGIKSASKPQPQGKKRKNILDEFSGGNQGFGNGGKTRNPLAGENFGGARMNTNMLSNENYGRGLGGINLLSSEFGGRQKKSNIPNGLGLLGQEFGNQQKSNKKKSHMNNQWGRW